MNSYLLIDYGGVLAHHYQDPAESALAEALGVDREALRALLSEKSLHGRDVRRGHISSHEFWTKVYTIAGADMRHRLPDKELNRLWAETYCIDAVLARQLCELKQSWRVGLVTNVDAGRDPFLRQSALEFSCWDLYFPSFQIGAVKAEDAFWQEVNVRIRAQGRITRALYVDDRTEHLQRAERVTGWDTLLYTGEVDIPRIQEMVRNNEF